MIKKNAVLNGFSAVRDHSADDENPFDDFHQVLYRFVQIKKVRA